MLGHSGPKIRWQCCCFGAFFDLTYDKTKQKHRQNQQANIQNKSVSSHKNWLLVVDFVSTCVKPCHLLIIDPYCIQRRRRRWADSVSLFEVQQWPNAPISSWWCPNSLAARTQPRQWQAAWRRNSLGSASETCSTLGTRSALHGLQQFLQKVCGGSCSCTPFQDGPCFVDWFEECQWSSCCWNFPGTIQVCEG